MSVSQQIWARLQLMFAQGKVTTVGGGKVQVRALDEEVLDNVRHAMPYGFSHHPTGGEAYMLFAAGDRAQGVALVVGDKRYAMSLAGGEVAIHDADGNHVHIKAGGEIEVKASTRVIADCPLFETTGDVKIGGNLVVVGEAQAAGFYGQDGSAATLAGGAQVQGQFTVNGKDVSDGHRHTGVLPGDVIEGVL